MECTRNECTKMHWIAYESALYPNPTVALYHLSGEWSKLPFPPVKRFAMTSFNDQLVLAGGNGKCTSVNAFYQKVDVAI